ncbi:2456_t:CDS:2 [Rhizophagus irregularis]|nr:2456_t:CDS:2 [Rhizophagus irregularis]
MVPTIEVPKIMTPIIAIPTIEVVITIEETPKMVPTIEIPKIKAPIPVITSVMTPTIAAPTIEVPKIKDPIPTTKTTGSTILLCRNVIKFTL